MFNNSQISNDGTQEKLNIVLKYLMLQGKGAELSKKAFSIEYKVSH